MRSQWHVSKRLQRTKMLDPLAIAVAVVLLTLLGSAQDDVPIFKAEAASAFVWGVDSAGVVSSTVRDPLTGNAIHKLRHGGVDISSQAGFETLRSGQAERLLNFTATISNKTGSALRVRQGAASIDGRIALPLEVVLSNKGLGKRKRAQVWELASMNCFSGGFLPNAVFLSPNASANQSTVTPNTALTVSFVVKDPRFYSILCSRDGCFPKGTIRFSLTLNTTDFVFEWPGQALVPCGK